MARIITFEEQTFCPYCRATIAYTYKELKKSVYSYRYTDFTHQKVPIGYKYIVCPNAKCKKEIEVERFG